MILFNLGGDEVEDSLQALRQSLKALDSSTRVLESYPLLLVNLQSLLTCHASGLRFVLNYADTDWDNLSKSWEFVVQDDPFDECDFDKVCANFVSFLK